MSKIKLIFPTEDMKAAALAFKQEFFDAGERTIYGSYKFDMEQYSYEKWVQMMRDNLSAETVSPKFGVSETYFAVNEEAEIVGIINFRHELTPFYADSGHVGCSVRPSCRGMGYGAAMLLEILDNARHAGLNEIKCVCKRSNVASANTIKKNGGVLVRTFGYNENLKDEYAIRIG